MTTKGRKMSVTAPEKPATAPAKQAEAKQSKPKVSLAGITVKAESAPLPKISRSANKEPNPFLDGMDESKRTGKPMGVTVPEAAASRATYLIRKAAEEKGYGVRIVPDEPVNGRVHIRFLAQDKRVVPTGAARKPRVKKSA